MSTTTGGADHRDLAVDAARLAAAADACAGRVVRTPLVEAELLSDLLGRPVLLKAESLQRTGSFKLRGATAKIAALGERARPGVIAASAGNHGRAVALAARDAGIPCTVFMPSFAAVTKTEATRALGATLRCEWSSVDDAVVAARTHAEEHGLAFIHPFDDLDVIAGQATLGSELLAEVGDLDTIIVPVGGGGLVSGLVSAMQHAGRSVGIVGVQAEVCAPFPTSIERGEPVGVMPHPTIADGIAVGRPGYLTLPLVARHVERIVTVTEDAIAEAVVHLFEHSKLVVEGAGAVGVAAILGGQVAARGRGPVVVVLSGGNIDPGLFGDAIRRHETRMGRRLVLLARLDDRPGTLAQLLDGIAGLGANVLVIEHDREGVDLPFGQTAVRVVVQTRDRAHGDELLRWTASAGLAVEELGGTGRTASPRVPGATTTEPATPPVVGGRSISAPATGGP